MEAHYTTSSVLAVIVGNCLASFINIFMLLLGINGNSVSRSLRKSIYYLACLAGILQRLAFLPIVGIWLEWCDSMVGANRWSILVVLQ